MSWKGKYVSDPKNENAQIWKYEAGNPSENQNTLMYNIMKSRIEIFDGIMKDKNFNIDNNTLLARIAGNIAQKAEKAGMTVDDYIKEICNVKNRIIKICNKIVEKIGIDEFKKRIEHGEWTGLGSYEDDTVRRLNINIINPCNRRKFYCHIDVLPQSCYHCWHPGNDSSK